MDTIFALASAKGRAGVAVVRISGPAALAALEQMSGYKMPDKGRRLLWLTEADGARIDQALCLSFAEGASFTGEQTVELHLHGSTAIVKAVLARLASLPGLRLAEAGEFTRRALENDRLNLTEVEGLSDLIEAETEAQRKQAQRVFSGAFGAMVEGWRRDLIRAAALVEATIDFADEDVPVDVSPEVHDLITSVRAGLQQQIAGQHYAERVRDGFEVAIIGPPNAGKSTLLNRLAGREAALISDIPGTTRDIVEVRMDIRGFAATVLDTAGLRETQDPVEAMGVSRALERAGAADIRIYLTETGETPDAVSLGPDDIVLQGKDDEGRAAGLSISGATGFGVDRLLDLIGQRLEDKAGQAGLATRLRHLVAMQAAAGHLEQAETRLATSEAQEELLAADLRAALKALDSVIGYVDVEHLLDEIFASFCLGK